MKKLVLILSFLLFTIPGMAQNTVIDHTQLGFKQLVTEGLDVMDIEGAVVFIQPLNEKIQNAYRKDVLAKAVEVQSHEKTYIIYLSEGADKLLVSHELIHIWQSYNGKPCGKSWANCEQEAEKKKTWVASSVSS